MPKRVHEKHKAHTVYKNAAGVRLPGVTTITAMLGWGQRTLINWANRMGLQGIDTTKFVDDKAAIGTLAHLLITDKLQGIDTDTKDYSASQIEEAYESVDNFNHWISERDFKPVLIEAELVSELYQYGGRIDIYGSDNGKFGIIDLKTGSGVYPEMIVQVGGGYANLLRENGYLVEFVRILNIPRSKTEGFIDKLISPETCRYALQALIHCREIYNLQKLIK